MKRAHVNLEELLQNGAIAFAALAVFAAEAIHAQTATPGGPVMGPVVPGPIVPGPTLDDTIPYEMVDNLEGDWVNLMNPPYRPMVLDGNGLWAVDNHNHQVHFFDDVSGNPSATFGVPAGPVSIAKWMDGQELRLLVVCRTSWVVCLLDAATGTILEVAQMRDPATGRQLGEPADIVVIGNEAYVSCSASDAVVELELPSLAITGVAYLPSKHPTFLSVDENGDVLVVPQASGNDTFVHRLGPNFFATTGHAGPLGIIDGRDTSIVEKGLNDYDVFRIDRSGTTLAVAPAARHVGTVLFAHGINPATHELWVLNTDANTRDSNLQSEPEINGIIAFNQLSIMTLQPGQVVTAPAPLDLDLHPDGMGGTFHDPAKTIGQPFNLEFGPGGYCFVVGLLTDNVTVLTPQGQFFLEWDLPAGSIPRAVVYSQPLNTAFVYCWGTNVVLGYAMTSLSAPWVECELGLDPTPPELKEGRATLFDGGKSLANRFSCLTCHVDGGFDGIAWNLGQPKDDKGPMLTQSLTGLETVHPFHWRGEQEGVGDQLMVDFNGAFANLLGGTELDTTPGAEWDRFEDFVFSLQQTANPNQNIRRRVDPDLHAELLLSQPQGDATLGQGLFVQVCTICHFLPKGTSNDFIADGVLDDHPHQMDFKVPGFQEDYRWEQDADKVTPGVQLEEVDFVDSQPDLPDTDDFPPLGGAFTHAGLFANLHHFVGIFLTVFTTEQVSHVTDYIHQWDNGLAPVAHRVYHVDQDSPASAFNGVRNYLVSQCTTPMATSSGQSVMNGDFAAIGTFEWQGVEIPMRWYWDPVTQRLIPEDSSIPPQTTQALLDQALQGKSANTFIGMPYGTARRFAVDYDGDGMFNADELAYVGAGAIVHPDPEQQDSDGDGWWDGYEIDRGSDPTLAASVPTADAGAPDFVNDTVDVLWTTSKTAVLRFEATEQSRAVVSYMTTGAGGSGHAGSATSRFAFHHRVVLANLDPEQTYGATVELFDHWGNPKQKVVSFATKAFNGIPRTKVGSLQFTQLPATPTSPITLRVMAADRKKAGPPVGVAGYQVAARLCLDGAFVGDADVDTFGQPKAFTVDGAQYTTLPGPFVIASALTDVNGFADLVFALPNAQAGQVLTVVIEVIQTPGANWTAAAPDYDDLAKWSHSDTPKLLRTIDLQL